MSTGTDELTKDSVHVLLLAQGLLAHSSTSMAQLPPSATLHSLWYCGIASYAQTPPANPGGQAHEYASAAMALLSHVPTLESVHTAPFEHGDDTHSLMSMSQ